ncbi:MAG: carboxypeptidase regulatory-like domain-containing protein, partial [Acidobacteria bacterium]|nr:carboxypeptidase regulatory-like domain-containing protein [Acidobacteriota bacterium]
MKVAARWGILPLAILLAYVLGAQDYRAKVQGTITDSSQASVAGAKVTLANAATGVETVRLSSATGQYMFDFVEPGTYNLAVERAGFGSHVEKGIVVQVRGDVTVDVALQVGSLSQRVEVTGAAVALQFNTSTMSVTVDRKMLDNLPVLARNPFSLALLDPAV